MTNAELIDGTYTGIASANAAEDPNPGSNVPRAKLSNAGFSIRYSGGHLADGGTSFISPSGTLMLFGSELNGGMGGDILKPDEAWGLDKKWMTVSRPMAD